MYKWEQSEDYMREWIVRPDGTYLCGTDAECPEDNTLSRSCSDVLGELNTLLEEVNHWKHQARAWAMETGVKLDV